jgi:hypothetical protein
MEHVVIGVDPHTLICAFVSIDECALGERVSEP